MSAEALLVRLPIALVLLGSLAALPAAAQRTTDLTTGIRSVSRSPETHSVALHSRAGQGGPSAAPYVVVGALVGAAIAGFWEVRTVSRNGNDFAGTAGLLWIPPAAGTVLGAFGGWLVFKIVQLRAPLPDERCS